MCATINLHSFVCKRTCLHVCLCVYQPLLCVLEEGKSGKVGRVVHNQQDASWSQTPGHVTEERGRLRQVSAAIMQQNLVKQSVLHAPTPTLALSDQLAEMLFCSHVRDWDGKHLVIVCLLVVNVAWHKGLHRLHQTELLLYPTWRWSQTNKRLH